MSRTKPFSDLNYFNPTLIQISRATQWSIFEMVRKLYQRAPPSVLLLCNKVICWVYAVKYDEYNVAGFTPVV